MLTCEQLQKEVLRRVQRYRWMPVNMYLLVKLEQEMNALLQEELPEVAKLMEFDVVQGSELAQVEARLVRKSGDSADYRWLRKHFDTPTLKILKALGGGWSPF